MNCVLLRESVGLMPDRGLKLNVNMKAVIVLCAMLTIVASDVALQMLKPHPDHPNACYVEDENKAYPVGSRWDLNGSCTVVTCSQTGENFLLSYTGCGVLAPPTPPCVIVVDKEAKHPGCCPKLKC